MISIRLLKIKLPQKTHNYRLNFILFNNVTIKKYTSVTMTSTPRLLHWYIDKLVNCIYEQMER